MDGLGKGQQCENEEARKGTHKFKFAIILTMNHDLLRPAAQAAQAVTTLVSQAGKILLFMFRKT
eukprot:2275545-Amphidinium_carterae.1